MARLVDYEGDVQVTYGDDAVRYSQNIDPVLDKIAAINNAGGNEATEGVGRLLYEFPVTLIMEHALERGIPWEHLAYRTGYDAEWHDMGRKWSKLTVNQRRKYM